MIIQSPTTPPPLPRSSVFDYIFPESSNAWYPAISPDAPAFIDGLDGSVLTRKELLRQALGVAGALHERGIKERDVALIFGPNSLLWIAALFGCQAAGVIVSPANFGYTEAELLHQLVDSTAKVVFCAPALIGTLEKALARPGSPTIDKERIIVLGQGQGSIHDMFGAKPTRRSGDEKETAYLCYSSGTTGRAKGVETTHHNMTSQLQAVNLVYQPLTKNDVVLGILPFSHIYGLTIVLHQPLTAGAPVVVLPRFEEIPVLEAIQRHRITWGLVVPPILLALLHSKQAANYDMSSLRGLQSGAAPLGVELIAAFEARFKIPVTQGYGLTETSPVTHVMTAEEARTRPGKIGRLMPTFECRLVHEGQDVGVGERGEMWFRGPSVMKGYWRNEKATRESFADGWFMTGDVAVVDENGYFSIVDRVKELIKYKGFQVAPAELEALLLSHPQVQDVAVIGVYDKDRATELPKAYIVAEGDPDAVRADIHAWLKTRVANHKRLRGGIEFIKAIPKSPSGKILRKDLRVQAKL